MIYCFDIDDTICYITGPDHTWDMAVPFPGAIEEINRLYDEGHRILIFTARGATTGIEWTDKTKEQLARWGVKYHELIMNKKPNFDLMIDDKAINAVDWRRRVLGTRGVVAGAFDLIHPGYVRMLRDCAEHCSHLTVLLHTDPTTERGKMRPVHTPEERMEILMSIRYVNEVQTYATEDELHQLLLTGNYHVRFLGEDYKDAVDKVTGFNAVPKIHFIDRKHGYSTTGLKKKIKDSYGTEV